MLLTSFYQKTKLSIKKGKYLIKTLDSTDEVKQALQLRHKIFYEELLESKSDTGLDYDEFDEICDHLVVLKNDRLVGTYRLISSTFSDKFYSETEFDLQSIKNLKGNKLELGRACIEKEYRSGPVLMHLWKGIFEYAKIIDASYIFGCSSVKETEYYEIAKIINELKNGNYIEDLGIKIKEQFKIHGLDAYIDLTNGEKPKNEIPCLFNSYLKAGAKIHQEPALDKDFQCIDFLTLLKFNNLNIDLKEKLE